MASTKFPPRNALGDEEEIRDKDGNRVASSNPETRKRNTQSQEKSPQSTSKASSDPPDRYPCQICIHQSTFPPTPQHPGIGKVRIERHFLAHRTHEYEYASTTRCHVCTTQFATIVTERTTERHIYERWRWAVEQFGNCQYIFEYATAWGTAGMWRYALFADVVQYLGDESDEDDWPGYPESVSIWEPDGDQECAVYIVPEPSLMEGRETDKAARLAALAVTMREADEAEVRLMETAEKAKNAKRGPRRERAWEEERKQRLQERENEKKERLFHARYEAAQKKDMPEEEILGIVAGGAKKEGEKKGGAKRRKESAASKQAAPLAATHDPDGDVEVEQVDKGPKYKVRKDGETDDAFERRVSKAEKTAATKAAKKVEREARERQQAAAAGERIAQDRDETEPHTQEERTDTTDKPDPPTKKPPAKKEPKQNRKQPRKENETDKQYAARIAKAEKTAAAKERMKAAKIRASGQAPAPASGPSSQAQNANEPSQPPQPAKEPQGTQAELDHKGKKAQRKKSPGKRKRQDDPDEAQEHALEGTGGTTAAASGSPAKKRKRGPRKPKRKPGDPIGFS
ncbi:hypothetical protein FKW77_002623 [Venturia effusa]|uniref:Uncharacterized protein n=1 Tax=Venturia effusa TaxID=50376 RepID=A0A517LIB1_9PEZI|nr:hypothetical protein FKW77_002623 [Venturia effusa]